MKKRYFALALALLLTFSLTALAEERYSTIEVEGAPEILMETKYENAEAGFVCWYAPEYFAVLWDTLADPQGQWMLHSLAEGGAPAYLTAEWPEKEQITGAAYLANRPLMDNLPTDSLSEVSVTQNDQGVVFSYRSGYDGESYYEYFAAQKGAKELLLRLCCPLNDLSNNGVRLTQAVFSFDLF